MGVYRLELLGSDEEKGLTKKRLEKELDNFRTMNKRLFQNTLKPFGQVLELTPNWSKEFVLDLVVISSIGPYLNLDNMVKSGFSIYGQMKISKLGDKGKYVRIN